MKCMCWEFYLARVTTSWIALFGPCCVSETVGFPDMEPVWSHRTCPQKCPMLGLIFAVAILKFFVIFEKGPPQIM